jgi:thiopeptide-type bacteriocin biosynthesis protein
MIVQPPPGPLVDAVRAVLAGSTLPDVAARSGLPAAELQAALTVYHQGGSAALADRAADRWYMVRLMVADQRRAEQTMARVVGPALDTLRGGRTAVGWWFLRETAGWRVYLRTPDPLAVSRLLRTLGKNADIAATQPEIYQPDPRPFGGLTGTSIAHELFVVDSRAVLDYTRLPDPPLARRELSIALVDSLLSTAGLDWSARSDVYTRLGTIYPPADPATVRRVGGELLAFLTDPALDLSVITGPWIDACATAGRTLADVADRGLLTLRISSVLAALVHAHWDRLGLPAATQAVLAHAATQVYAVPREPHRCVSPKEVS